jgi:DNA-binding SARP family transcriptional activator
MALFIGILGPLLIRIDDRRLVKVPKKALALLAYLAAQGGEGVSRERLADLLWPYQGSEQARNSLRNCLLELRKTLGPSHHLVTDLATCRIFDVDVDRDRFERLSHSQRRSDLQAAADLYRGEFLADFVINSEPFQEWMAAERDRTLSAVSEVLYRLTEAQHAAGEHNDAIRSGRRLVAIDPLSELGHRALMRAYSRAGRRGEALRQYKSCAEILKRELGAAPDSETQALANEIARSGLSSEPEVDASIQATAEETLKTLPRQAIAPIRVAWSGGRLKRVNFYPENVQEAPVDGRLSNYQYLQEEAERLFGMLRSNNAAQRVVDSLIAYISVLGKNLEQLDIFRLGHIGIRLSATITGSKEILSNENFSELCGFVASHELFMAQETKWRKYISKSVDETISENQDILAREIGVQLIGELEKFNDVLIDLDITQWLAEMRKEIDEGQAERRDRLLVYGFWKSLENTFVALLRSVIRYARDEVRDFAHDFSREVRKQVVDKGAKTTATIIVSSCSGLLVALAANEALGFSWVTKVIEFLRVASSFIL